MSHEMRVESLGILALMGVILYGDPRSVNFSASWNHFGKVADDAGLSRIGKDLYGLQIYSPWFPKRFEITYMASIARESLVEVPVRMVEKTIAASQ